MPITLLSDTFTGADNTLLTAHTMDVGGGWVNSQGTFKISGNAAAPNSANNNDVVVANAGLGGTASNPITVSCLSTPRSSTGAWESDSGLVFRWSDPSNFWVYHITAAGFGGTGAVQLFKFVNGIQIQFPAVPVSIVSGTTYTITATLADSLVTLLLNGTLVSSASDSFNQAAIWYGFYYGTAGAVSIPATWDNFLVTAPAPAPAPPRLLIAKAFTTGPNSKFQGRPYPFSAPAPAVPPPAVVASPPPPLVFARGIVGRPWSFTPRVQPPPPTSVPPAPAPVVAKTQEFPLRRVADPANDPQGLRQHTETISDIINSLTRAGVLVRVSPGKWALTVTGSGGSTPPPVLTADQIAALFSSLAGPNQFWGGPGPAFRAIANADLPAITPSPAGTYRYATQVVDQHGLVQSIVESSQYALVFNNADELIQSNATTYLSFNSVYENTGGFVGSDTTKLTCPTGQGGIYFMSGFVRFEPNTAGVRLIAIQRNSGPVLCTTTLPAVPTVGSTTDLGTQNFFRFRDGDYIQCYVRQTSGVALNANFVGNFSINFGCVRVADI